MLLRIPRRTVSRPLASYVPRTARTYTSGGSANSYLTTFPLTENPISEGGIWVRGLAEGLDWKNPATGLASDGTTRVAYGARVPSNNFDDAIAHLKSYSANHWCQGTIYNDGSVTGLPEVELLLRSTISANSAIQYEIDILADGRLYIVQWLGALSNFHIEAGPITTNVSIANSAVWYAQINGNTIIVKCNGTQVYTGDITTFLNAAINAGNPGMGFYANNGTPDPNTQANRTFAFKAFSVGNL